MLSMLAVLMMLADPNAFYVATYVDVQMNSTGEAAALIRQYREAAQAEKGNSGIDVVQEIGRPYHLVIIELWKDQAAFEAHEKSASAVQFRSRLKAIHNSPYDQRVHLGLAVDSRSWPAVRGAVSVVTHVDVPPPQKDQTEAWLKRMAEESRKDDGNLRYDVFQQTAPRTNHFTVLEVWKDRNAFESHEMKAHTRQFREALGPMLGAPYDERLYTGQ
jgi:quinol monooxygenase YgiN